MNVCLIKPPDFMDAKGVRMNPTPSIGLAYIAGALKQAGHRVMVIDAVGESPKQFNPIGFKPNITFPLPEIQRLVTNGLSTAEIIERIPAEVDVIGVSLMFSNNWLADRYLINRLGAEFPKALIVAGGESITAMPQLALAQTTGLHVCVLGEGEETIVELVKALEAGRPLSEVNGIVYRGTDNQAASTPRRVRVKNVDEIPMPAWEFFPLDNYQKYKIQWGITDRKSLPVMATRGCPYSCTFCSSPQMWGTRYYMRKAKDVVDEMEYMANTYNISNFDFYDLTAIIKKDWIIEFTQELIARNLNITWQLPVGTRSESIDEEVSQNLYASGCINIAYAPESGSPRMLKLIKKKVKLDNMLQSMRSAHKQKLYIYINMILALPDETHADVWRTIWFLIQCSWVGVNEIGPGVFQPYPGSALFERLIKEGRIDLANDDFFMEILVINSFGKSKYYNDKISAGWYNLYEVMTVGIFFASNYLFRPARFLRTMRNLITRKYESRAERALLDYLQTKTAGLKNTKTKELEPALD